MKCFTVRFENGFIADEIQPLRKGYDGFTLLIVKEIDEAKHYKNNTIPNKWIKISLERIEDAIKTWNTQKRSSKSNTYAYQYIQRGLNTANEFIRLFKGAVVVEADLEHPNFPAELKPRWRRHYWDTNFSEREHKSRMELSCVSHSRFECKSCGVILKHIPFYNLHDGNSTKVCVGCLHIRSEAIKKAFESLPEDFRTSFTNELILGSL